MRIRNKILVISLVAILFHSLGCSDWLNEQPLNTVTEDLAWQDGKDAEGAVAAAFTVFRRALGGLTRSDTPATTRYGAWGDYYFWGDARCGDWITPNDDSDWLACIENRLIEQTQLAPLSNWRLFYRTIEQCNLILENLPGIEKNFSPERREELLAEARFLRAMAHFYAARIWGDVPINLKARNVEPLGRSPLDEVMRMVVNEVDLAIPTLPWLYAGSENRKQSITRGTKGAALALKAHACMWLEDYKGASEAIDLIVQSGTFKIVPIELFRELFDECNSEEMIFEMFFDAKLGEFSGYYGHILTYYLTNPYTSRTDLSLAVPKTKILEIFPEYELNGSDKRVPEFFQSIDFSISSNQLRPVFPDPLHNGEREIMFAKFRKIKDRSYDQMDGVIPVFRYAGILLLQAEADARLGNTDKALVNLNIIKQRAGIRDYVFTDDESLIEEILEERRRELIGEQHRVYDLVRLGRLHEFNSFITVEDENIGAAFYPVDPEAFVNNPNMTQTLYWQFNK